MTPPVRRRFRREELCDRHEAAEMLGIHVNSVDRLGRDKILSRYGIKGMTHTVLYSREQVAGLIIELDEEAS